MRWVETKPSNKIDRRSCQGFSEKVRICQAQEVREKGVCSIGPGKGLEEAMQELELGSLKQLIQSH